MDHYHRASTGIFTFAPNDDIPQVLPADGSFIITDPVTIVIIIGNVPAVEVSVAIDVAKRALKVDAESERR